MQLVPRGTLNRLLETAEFARQRRDFQQCAEILERANRLDPANSSILLNLGHVHGLRFDYAAAEHWFDRAVRLAPKKAEALTGAGLRARDFGNYRLAERYYRLAAAQKDVSPEALVSLAEICERLSQLEEANQLVDQALQLKQNLPSAILLRAKLARQAGRLEEAEAQLRAFPLNAAPDTRARCLYELGGILDRQGRYDEAMAAFLEAKSLLRPGASQVMRERKIMRARLKLLRESLTPETLRRWSDSTEALQPKYRMAILCGHPRSGTTLLEQVLDAHAEAISAEETDIFHNEAYLPLTRNLPQDAPMLSSLESASTGSLLNSRQNYIRAIEAFLGNPLGERLLIDKNPYLTFLIAPIARIFPEARFMIALRDPRDVCLSCFMQPFAPVGGTSSAYLSLEDTVGEYGELMSMYQTVALQVSNSVIEVRYEDMVEDLEGVSRRIMEFVGLPWDSQVLQFHQHAREKIVRSPTYADVKQPVFKRAVGRWHHYEKYLAPHLEKLAPFAKAFGYKS